MSMFVICAWRCKSPLFWPFLHSGYTHCSGGCRHQYWWIPVQAVSWVQLCMRNRNSPPGRGSSQIGSLLLIHICFLLNPGCMEEAESSAALAVLYGEVEQIFSHSCPLTKFYRIALQWGLLPYMVQPKIQIQNFLWSFIIYTLLAHSCMFTKLLYHHRMW